MKWTIKRTVSPHDLDLNDIASPSAVLRFMQEAAYMQMQYCKPTMNELRAENKVFVVSRTSMSIYSPINVCDEIEASSWACDSKGVSFLRCAEIRRDGELVAELASVWALINPETKTLWRVSDYTPSYETDEPLELDIPSRIRIPKDVSLLLSGEYRVSYNDADVNRHINNTHYPDILCGFLPEMAGKRVVKFAISYVHEAPVGEVLKIYTSKEEDGSFWVRSVKEDGSINVEAEIVLEDI
jgi:acyl-ACP thioesterase